MPASAPEAWAEATVRLAMQFTQANGPGVAGKVGRRLGRGGLAGHGLDQAEGRSGNDPLRRRPDLGCGHVGTQQGKTARISSLRPKVRGSRARKAEPERVQAESPAPASRSILGGMGTVWLA